MSVVPNAPSAGLTADVIQTRYNLKAGEGADVLQLAVTTVNRELVGAFRDVPQDVYDELVSRVAGAIVGSRRRPAGGNGQLTRTEQEAPGLPAPRDYATPIRPTLALYVSPV